MKDFLKDNTQVREDILNQKLFFELKEASALHGIHLKTFRSDVDIDGFDIILDNNDDLILKCQVKSRFDSVTPNFEFHRIMLKPNHFVFDDFEFSAPQGCPSDNRGVIQIDGDIAADKITSKYFYLDIYLLRAMEIGMFKLTNQSKRIAEQILNELRFGMGLSNSKINVNQSLFFPLKDTQALLAIMGFHSTFNSNLTYNIIQISKLVSGTTEKQYSSLEERIPDMKGHWNYVNDELERLVDPSKSFTKCPLNDNYFDRPPLQI
jgi:hypothetical protein